MKIEIKDSRFCIFFIVISFVTTILLLSYYELSFAQKDNGNDEEEDEDDKDKDKLVVKAHINLKNIDLEKTKFIRVVGFINGEDIKQDIPISSIDSTNKKTLDVDLKTDIENEIVEADTPDEFFVCAYQVEDNILTKNNVLPKFDCNEGDLLHIDKPTEISLFKSESQVYSKSQAVYESSLNTINNNINSNIVKIKIYVPLADKKDTEKLKIGTMIKGQIKSEVIEDVQAELDKSGDTIKRIFTFDRNTDVGKIQIGDRYHACVSSDDLRPPEGTECEKRLIIHLDKPNSLPAR
jgi:hypothetical protein